MPTHPDPPIAAAPPHPPDLRRRTVSDTSPSPPALSTAPTAPVAASTAPNPTVHTSPISPSPAPTHAPALTVTPAEPTVPQNTAQNAVVQPPNQPSLRARAMAGAVGLSLVTAAVGGSYLLSDNDAMFPFAVAACVVTFSSVLLRIALAGITADGAARARVRHFRSHRHFTGERAAYVRTSQRLAMMDRDFTAADYDMLLDLDNNSQRLRRFLEGASHEAVGRLPTYIYRAEKDGGVGESVADAKLHDDIDDRETEHVATAKEPSRTASAADLPVLRQDDDSDDSPEIVGATAKCCTICLEDFEDGMKIRVLPCFHRFMADCIDPWLIQQARCPVCKFSIQEVMNKLPSGCN